MAKGKTKKHTIIPNPELVEAWNGFRPIFGDHTDRSIVERGNSLNKELESVDNKILRGPQNKHTKKMKDILFRENSLISAIISRNMDF